MLTFKRQSGVLRDRLAEIAARVSLDLDVDALAARPATKDGIPEWWTRHGNVLLAPRRATVSIRLHPKRRPPRDAIIVLEAGSAAPPLVLWDDAPFVYVGRQVQCPNGLISCGGRSSVVLSHHLVCNGKVRVDARNGGLVFVGPHGLWADQVAVTTDDMHRIFDVETGERINRFGSTIRIEEHVWLGQGVAVNPGASIGRDSVIGRKSIVIGDIPANSLAVGTPARVVRAGIDWSAEDTLD